MKRIVLTVTGLFCLSLACPEGFGIAAPVETEERKENRGSLSHEWIHIGTDHETIEVDTHSYNYWKNFIKRTRSCLISHEIKTEIFYCKLHDHTKTKSSVERVIHSDNHSGKH
ncbi:hypothetical protein [Sediminibacillus massiliensis]|uniref:hypothetical protein n=1 Tax=Sediminibacillus massiliensis TaxID=1926277 RepID=UPI0009887FD2|nr:hypothetical protein [Sediminibacillus massiliensis]